MNRKYYAKYREVVDLKNDKVKVVYTPVIFIKGRETYVSDNGEIIELKNKDEALKIAKNIYERINKKDK